MKKSYVVVRTFPLPNGTKAAAGSTVELTREEAKYLLLSGKIVDAAAKITSDVKPARATRAPKPEEPKGE